MSLNYFHSVSVFGMWFKESSSDKATYS